jgi:hypothetical protein
LDIALAQKLGVSSFLYGGNGEGTTSPCRGLLENKGYVFVLESSRIDARPLERLVVLGEVEEVPELISRELV